jgi:hypothetical protein
MQCLIAACRWAKREPVCRFMICAGLDLGQTQDHAALVIGRADFNPLSIGLRLIRQYPIKTSYAEIIPDVVATLNAAGEPVALACDARGPGKPVIDILAAWPGLRLRRLLAVSNTSRGDARQEPRRERDPEFLERWNVPKTLLLECLLRLLRTERLRVDSVAGAELLGDQLRNFGYKFSAAGNVKLEALAGHDDVLLALMILVWGAVTEGKSGGLGRRSG